MLCHMRRKFRLNSQMLVCMKVKLGCGGGPLLQMDCDQGELIRSNQMKKNKDLQLCVVQCGHLQAWWMDSQIEMILMLDCKLLKFQIGSYSLNGVHAK